ncbi:M48 family metalloprotease [Rufibacter roseus]|uniref:M48 family metalloprotease n=1 Tax=Rufibacter roseus TaxID=1567108 RepID=A0ABW2DUE9_9BACT|nr:M48 family metalloprotease [Rufibacter roseus]
MTFTSTARILFFLFVPPLLLLGGCGTDKNGDHVFFSIEDDIALGQQVARQVDSTYRAKGQLLERNSSNPNTRRAYAYLDKIVERLLNSGQVTHRDDFAWDVKLIKDPDNLNAFATPGGHIYVFTGLIQYLDSEDQLAGVLGHEIAHADQRHTIKQLQKQYGISFLLSLALGDNSGELERITGQIIGQLAGLKFSRDYERESDDYSVLYLGGTDYYACDGAAGFFQKMQNAEQRGNPPEFLSTHPSPGNRVQNIQTKAQQEGCATTRSGSSNYEQFKQLLR